MVAPIHDWPVQPGLGARPRSAAQRPPPVRWVLLVAALLCGTTVSGAVFAVVWSQAIHRGDAAQARLSGQQAQLDDLAGTARRLQAALARERALRLTAGRRARTLEGEVGALRARRKSLASAASGVGQAAAPLPGELGTIAAYLRRGDAIDRGYLQTQVSYLQRQVARVRDRAAALARAG